MITMEQCSYCGRERYDDHPKHTVSGDCIRGFNIDGDKMILCWDCRPLYILVKDDSGLNKFQLKGE